MFWIHLMFFICSYNTCFSRHNSVSYSIWNAFNSVAGDQNGIIVLCKSFVACGQICWNHFHPLRQQLWRRFAESLKHRRNHVVDFLHDSAICFPGSLTALCYSIFVSYRNGFVLQYFSSTELKSKSCITKDYKSIWFSTLKYVFFLLHTAHWHALHVNNDLIPWSHLCVV